MDPIQAILSNRAEARKIQDPNADICFLALASADGKASVRTLVLRDIKENRFTLFINQTSPKWQLLSHAADYELLLWYPSQQKQFRVRGSFERMDANLVRTNWQRRPHGSKYLDYVYQEMADQSSLLDSREALEKEVLRLKHTYEVDELVPPDAVAGIELIATSIDMLDLNRADQIHDRQLFSLKNGNWHSDPLVP